MSEELSCVVMLAASFLLGSADAKTLVALLETRYRTARTLQAKFLEQYKEDGRIVRVEAGTAYFRRPGKMRWEYDSPEKNLFLVDGKTAWFYVPAEHTVTRVPAKVSTDWRTPLALLAGEGKLSRVCARIELTNAVAAENAGDAMLYCKLRGAEQVPHQAAGADGLEESGQERVAFLEIARESGNLVRVLIRERGGVELEFHFGNWQFDPPAAESLFRFAPPLGVAIVDAERLAEHVTAEP